VRALLDSSVLIAAYISRAGVCAELLEDVLMDHELVVSEFILNELARKLNEKFGFPENEIAEIRESIVSSAEIVAPAEVPAASCRDPNDLPVLGTAVAGRVDVLITVDKNLLDLTSHGEILIIRPGAFWKRVDQENESPTGTTPKAE
jgi:putative PIN family toxin of toxin-antitoxin system